MHYLEKLKEYFASYYFKDIDPDDNLFELGVLDSLGLVNLLTHLEARLGITIDSSAVNEQNFSTLNAIVAVIERHQ